MIALAIICIGLLVVLYFEERRVDQAVKGRLVAMENTIRAMNDLEDADRKLSNLRQLVSCLLNELNDNKRRSEAAEAKLREQDVLLQWIADHSVSLDMYNLALDNIRELEALIASERL